MKSGSQASTISKQCDRSSDISTIFWQQWQQYRDYLYRCCIKWMGGNSIDAEDALSRAMLKAWEKVPKYAGEIANFKAWLTKLTYNLCVDIYRERSRSANRVEDIEVIGEEQGLVCFEVTPLCAMEADEKRIMIRSAINNLPTRLRETFILHFYEEIPHQEIAQQQEISYHNVCKRISQARAILRQKLQGYFIEDDGTNTDKVAARPAKSKKAAQKAAQVEPILPETVTLSEQLEEYEELSNQEIGNRQEISCQNVCQGISEARNILGLELRKTELALTPTVTEPKIKGMSKGNARVEPIVGEQVRLFSQVKEVGVVVEQSQEAVFSVEVIHLVLVPGQSDEKLEEIEIVWCEDSVIFEKQPTPTWAKDEVYFINSQTAISPHKRPYYQRGRSVQKLIQSTFGR